jgi:putative nucleotidyltransferase with HDIG domain
MTPSSAGLLDALRATLRGWVGLDVTRLIVALVSAAFASLFLPQPAWVDARQVWVGAFVVLTGISIVLEFFAVELPHGGIVSVATMSHVATILLVPPPFAALSVGSAILVEEVVHRRPAARLAFNTASYVLTVSLASFAVSLIGDPRALVAGREHLPLAVMVVVVSIVYYLVNDTLTNTIMALASGRPLAYLLRTNGRSTFLAEAGAGMVGVVFALIWIVEPVWTALLAVPGAVITRAFQYIRQLERETRSAVGSLAEVVDHRDASTFHHSERVAIYATELAHELGFDEELVELIGQAAAVHDLGKIGIPDRILLKPGPLSFEERTAMWLHTEIGARILSQFHLFRSGADIVLHHHEAFDGSGYPGRLAGEAIPLGSRVVAVADAFDAMTSDRPYRSALSLAEAYDRLRAGAGRQWDPTVVDALLRLVEAGHPSFAPATTSAEPLKDDMAGHDDTPPAPGHRPGERDAA